MTDYDPLTPVQIEQHMGQAISHIKERVEMVNASRVEFKSAKRKHRVAMSLAGTAPENKGSRDDRVDRAIIQCQATQEALDNAESAAQYATDLVNLAEKELSALQTVAKLVLQAYNVSTR